MGANTKIEWCDHTLNPWVGCTKVSPACDNCYAEELMQNRYKRAVWGAGEPRVRTAVSTWDQARKWDRQAAKAGTRPFVFCASLADVFDNEVEPEWRRDLFALIEATPNLIWLLLTKRIGNVGKMTDPTRGCLPLPANVAIGATMVTQDEYDRDCYKLQDAKRLGALFTFGSFEPLLSPIRLNDVAPDWIIVGGESGQSARPMDMDWARVLKADSQRLGRVFNFKQVGGRGASKGGHELDGQTYFARPALPHEGMTSL